MTDIHEELAVQYAMALRERPGASTDELAERMVARLNEDQRLVLAEEALLFSEEVLGRRELAVLAARNFVRAMETDPDDNDDNDDDDDEG